MIARRQGYSAGHDALEPPESPVKRPSVYEVPLRVLASLAQVGHDEAYRRFRLPTAPTAVAHVSCVAVYDVQAGMRHLGASEEAISATLARLDVLSADLEPELPSVHPGFADHPPV